MIETQSRTPRQVFIRGKAVACALGDKIEGIVAGLRRGAVQVDWLPLDLIEPDEKRPYYVMSGKAQNCWEDVPGRFFGVLLDMVERTIADAGLSSEAVGGMGIFFGSTAMNIPIFEEKFACADDGQWNYLSQNASGFGVIAGRVARQFGIHGPCFTFCTACTSSANALLYATSLIAQGELERALVIGYDLYNHLGYYGFESLKLLSSSAYRPFDKRRDGVIMGEACGAVILDTSPLHPGDFRILGGASACDTYNVALHNTDGQVVARVMRQALDTVGLPPKAVEAIKAHATGSYPNDLTESNAIRQVFGNRVPPVTALKPYVGHTVGASGVVELILFSESLRQGFLPATPGFEVPDEELDLIPLAQRMPVGAGVFMLNYFGFGGNCNTLMIGNEE